MSAAELGAVLAPALFAGLVAICVTVAIERWGGRIGGLIGTLPTTIVPAAAGIAIHSATVADFRAAMAVAPAGMILNAIFLYLWRVVPPRLPTWSLRDRLALMTALALTAWFVGALLTVLGIGFLQQSGVPLLPVGIGLTLVLASMGVLACLSAPPAPAGSRRVGPVTLVARGVVAATAIAASMWLASIGGALAAGIAAVFPAIFLTTMVSLWIAQGESVPTGAVGPMMLGSTSVAVYSLIAGWALPEWGIVVGSVVSWVGAVSVATLPAWWWLQRVTQRPRREAPGTT